MKVLYITNIPSPYRIDFFNELSKHCDLTVIVERKNAKWRNPEWLKTDNISFNIHYLKNINLGKENVFCPDALKYIKKEKFDIIVVGGYSTLTGMIVIKYLKRKKIPFVLNCDGGFIKEDSKIKYKIKKYFISSASAWLSTGNETDKYLKFYGAKEEFIYRYSFTSSMEKDIKKEIIKEDEKEKIKKELGIKEKKVIITVGQFIYRKGFDILLQSSKNFPKDIGVYIIGGEPTEEYINIKEELRLENVYFVGFKQKSELKKYYKAADLFVLPTREDIWGLVINEAMSYGLPVITTEKCVAGLELIENSENGYIIPTNNSKELYEKTIKIIEDDGLRKNMSLNNIEKIRKYTIENMAIEHMNIFKKIFKKGK